MNKFLKISPYLFSTQRGCCKVIKSSKYGQIQIPEKTLSEYLFEDCDKFLNKPLITCASTGKKYNFGDVIRLSDQFRHSLKEKIGLRKGQVLGLILPNTPDFPVTVLGALDNGNVVTFINPIFTADEISKQFENAGVKCIVTIPELKDVVDKVHPKLQGYRGTVYISDDVYEYNGNSLLDEAQSAGIKKESINIHETAILPYSSGTTGVPKGVVLSHYNCVANICQVLHPPILELLPNTVDERDRILNVIPFFHIYGFNGVMNLSIRRGSHIISLPKFTPELYIECLIKYKPTVLITVPSLLLFLASHPAVKAEHLNSVGQVMTGAASATRSLLEKFKEKLKRKDVLISQGYGMTELSPAALVTPRNSPDSKMGSVGVLPPLTEARIICLKTGNDLPTNKNGELLIRGPQVMKGYLGNEKATKDSIDEDSWLHTGDVAYYDEDGYFYIVDRTKELIKVKGNQVSPTELEGKLIEIPEIADAAVVGIPDDKCGEVPRAFVVLKTGQEINEGKINQLINPQLAPYKRLTGGIRFIEAIPRSHTGKILREKLKALS